jgi:glutamine synthetase adenylyltransferase
MSISDSLDELEAVMTQSEQTKRTSMLKEYKKLSIDLNHARKLSDKLKISKKLADLENYYRKQYGIIISDEEERERSQG